MDGIIRERERDRVNEKDREILDDRFRREKGGRGNVK